GGYNPNGEAQQRILNKANNDTSGGFRDTQITLSETHVFGPTLVNDFRAGFVQEHNYTIASSSPSPELGIKNVLLYEFPQISLSNPGMIPLGSSASNGDRDRSYVFSEALNWVHGRTISRPAATIAGRCGTTTVPVSSPAAMRSTEVSRTCPGRRTPDPGSPTCCLATVRAPPSTLPITPTAGTSTPAASTCRTIS